MMSTAVRTIVLALFAPLAMACAQGGSGTDLPIDSSSSKPPTKTNSIATESKIAMNRIA